MQTSRFHIVIVVLFVSLALISSFVFLLGDETTGMIVRGEDGLLVLKPHTPVEIHDRILRVEQVQENVVLFSVYSQGQKYESFCSVGDVVLLDDLEIEPYRIFSDPGSARTRVQVLVRDVRTGTSFSGGA